MSPMSRVRYPVQPHNSFLLPLIQEGHLSVTGESMCTKYWLTTWEVGLSLPGKSVVRLTDRPDMTIDVYLARKITTTTLFRRRPVLNDFSCETAGPIVTEFHIHPPWSLGTKKFLKYGSHDQHDCHAHIW